MTLENETISLRTFKPRTTPIPTHNAVEPRETTADKATIAPTTFTPVSPSIICSRISNQSNPHAAPTASAAGTSVGSSPTVTNSPTDTSEATLTERPGARSNKLARFAPAASSTALRNTPDAPPSVTSAEANNDHSNPPTIFTSPVVTLLYLSSRRWPDKPSTAGLAPDVIQEAEDTEPDRQLKSSEADGGIERLDADRHEDDHRTECADDHDRDATDAAQGSVAIVRPEESFVRQRWTNDGPQHRGAGCCSEKHHDNDHGRSRFHSETTTDDRRPSQAHAPSQGSHHVLSLPEAMQKASEVSSCVSVVEGGLDLDDDFVEFAHVEREPDFETESRRQLDLVEHVLADGSLTGQRRRELLAGRP